MRIIEVSVSKKFNLGNYQMLDIGMVGSIELNEDNNTSEFIQEKTKELYAEVEKAGNKIKEDMLI